MNTDQNRMFLAVTLSALLLIGWQYFFAPKNSSNLTNNQTQQISSESVPVTKTSNQDSEVTQVSSNTNDNELSAKAATKIQNYDLKFGKINLSVNSNLVFTKFKNENSLINWKEFNSNQDGFLIEFLEGESYQSLPFVINNMPDSFKAENLDKKIIVTLKNDERGMIAVNLVNPLNIPLRFVLKSSAKKLENGKERAFVYFTNQLESIIIGADEDGGENKIQWAGLDFNYHLLSLSFPDKLNSVFKYGLKDQNHIFTMRPIKSFEKIEFNLFYGLKEFDYLGKLGDNLDKSVDFGIWGVFAVWLLRALQFFYKFIPNYGVSIIILTIVIRLLTFPLQIKSFKSMKKLQEIQPDLAKLKEKFKDDPQRMQKESMELFKRSGANPLGGCLPLLLQMPIFFAFYKVLFSAVELVGAPFYFWIIDLSVKDPFYVLPVLMTISMFLQQKMTPTTTTDPVQKKVLMFMPLIFGFIMKDLPSGLSLYIFVSTIMGILQQLYVYKKSN